ncbi:hypothetical protein CEXT_582771 [Caerostris extrusa]|uniref:Uncharacterized protein n=1 Tax=Caerostris extrusa TaxID=172846 RepID=A0AAV4YCD3_CAEEX|nr:hypothetical protein CEXT_582771 [Caerostris extrusa]
MDREDTSSSNDSLGKEDATQFRSERNYGPSNRGLHQQVSSSGARFTALPLRPFKALHPIKQIEMTSATISNPGRFERETSHSGGVRINSCYEAPKISEGSVPKVPSFFLVVSIFERSSICAVLRKLFRH